MTAANSDKSKDDKPKDDKPKDDKKKPTIEAIMEELQRIADVLSGMKDQDHGGIALDRAIVHVIDAKNDLDKSQVF